MWSAATELEIARSHSYSQFGSSGGDMFPVSVSVPTRFQPAVTYALIGTNALVFLLQASLPDRAQEAVAYSYGLVPARYTNPEWALRVGLDPGDYLPLVTNMFMHGGWLHLILNMWTLWLFGPAIEDRLGKTRFLAFYLASGLAAGLTHAWVNADSTIPAVGASGGIVSGRSLCHLHRRSRC